MDLECLVDAEFVSWYARGLPPALSETLAGDWPLCGKVGTLPGREGLPQGEFAELLEESLLLAAQRRPYHNLGHGQDVTVNGEEALDAWGRLAGQALPVGVTQAILVALAQHDRGHPGATFFATAREQWRPAGASLDMSVEWYSAMMFAEWALEARLELWQILLGVYIIWSSTAGASTETGRSLGIPDFQPRRFGGCLMRTVDSVTSNNFVHSLHADVAVNYEEVPARSAAQTEAEYLQRRLRFLRYAADCCCQLDAAAGVGLTDYLGWRANVRRQREAVEAMIAGRAPAKLAALRSQLRDRGVDPW